MSNINKLDQYYTKPEYAKHLSEKVRMMFPDYNYVEPSAGEGSFSSCFDNIISYDLDPKFRGCIKQDFLQTTQKDFMDKTLFIGNPPFGKNSSLAVKFFNHCAKTGDVICFILPKTFKKIFFKDRLNDFMHLTYEEDCPNNSFVLEGKSWDVPCVFQIWKKENFPRVKVTLCKNEWFAVGDINNYDLAVRRVGGRAGKVLENNQTYSESSTYFLKSLVPDLKSQLIHLYPILKEQASNSAGVKSISLKELQYFLQKNSGGIWVT